MATPLHRVLLDGRVERLGEWDGAERLLRLEGPGYPLLGPGEHRLEGELPWVFWDMAPSGFLGRVFARTETALRLSHDPRTWSARDVVAALTGAGEDLTGNLLLGDETLRRHLEAAGRPQPVLPQDLSTLLTLVPSGPGATSSVGGERPKFSGFSAARQAFVLVKYSPPLDTAPGQRWSDLLRVEAHCAEVLREAGLSAVEATATVQSGRTLLQMPRFDRVGPHGRRGATTLYWYAAAELGEVRLSAPEVVRQLVDAGHLPGQALASVETVHAFSAAIGNTDAHLANYGLQFEEDGRASLAPFYDVLPMALAPAHDELPDARLSPRPPAALPEAVAPLVERLLERVESDEAISRPFIGLWRRTMGLGP